MTERKNNTLLNKLNEYVRDLKLETKGINCYINPTQYSNSIFIVICPYAVKLAEHKKINLYLCQTTAPIGIIYQFNNVHNTKINDFVFKYNVLHQHLKEEFENNLKDILKSIKCGDDYTDICYYLFMKIYTFIIDNCQSMLNPSDSESMLNMKYFAYKKSKDKNYSKEQQKKYITLETKKIKKYIVKNRDERYFHKHNQPEEKSRHHSPSNIRIYNGRSRLSRDRSNSPRRHQLNSPRRSPRNVKSRSPRRHRSRSLERSRSRSQRRTQSHSLRRSKSPKLEHSSPRNQPINVFREHTQAVVQPMPYQPAYIPQTNMQSHINPHIHPNIMMHPAIREKINQIAMLHAQQIVYHMLPKSIN